MKVKCLKTKIEDTKNFIINADMDDYIQIGEIFIVYEIQIIKSQKYYGVLWEEKLVLLPSQFFEVLDTKTPDIWKIKIYEDGDIVIAPEELLNEYFFDRFSDDKSVEVEQFERIKPFFE